MTAFWVTTCFLQAFFTYRKPCLYLHVLRIVQIWPWFELGT